MRLLITGSEGFVGKHLIQVAKELGWEVHGTTLPGAARGEEVATYPLDLVTGDVENLLKQIQPDYICHLAGISSVAQSWRFPEETLRVNTIGSIRLLNAVRDCLPGARVLTVGSAEEYGLVRTSTPVGEDTLLQPMSPYGTSKAAVGHLARQYARAYGLQVCHARPFNHIGAGQALGFVTTDFASQLVAMERGQIPAEIQVGNLEAQRDFTNVVDIVHGYLALLQRGQAGEVYNLASGQAVSISMILKMMIEETKVQVKVSVDTGRLRPSEVPVLVGDISKIQLVTGWTPSIPLEQSIREVMEDWRSKS